MFENFYRIMCNYSEILDGGGARRDHAMAYAGIVHLNAEKIRRLVFTRELHQGIAIAEAVSPVPGGVDTPDDLQRVIENFSD